MSDVIDVSVDSPAAMMALGRRLANVLEPGDLLVLSGELGAGKTTLARGIGEGLGVRGPVTSPTFVIARRHPSLSNGPALVHVDAYRLGSTAEIDDLDLDIEGAVTVVEWGAGRVEHLSDSWLLIDLREDGQGRCASIRPVGPRWDSVDFALVLSAR